MKKSRKKKGFSLLLALGLVISVLTLSACAEKQSELTIDGPSVLYVGQEVQLTASGGSGAGAVTFEAVGGSDNCTLTAQGLLTALKAGEVRVRAKKAAADGYGEAVSQELGITISAVSAAAKNVVDSIDALPAPDSLRYGDKAAVELIRAYFEALPAAEKAQVANLSALAAAEEKITELGTAVDSASLSAQPAKKDYTRGEQLDVTGGKLTAVFVNGTVSTVDLTSDMVTGFEPLTPGGQTLTVSYADKSAGTYGVTVSNPAAVTAVIDLIAALPAGGELALSDENAVAAARIAYDALPGGLYKGWVSNYDALTAAEARIAVLKEEKSIRDVVDLIAALPAVGQLRYADKTAVEAARSAYEALEPSRQGRVDNLDVLEAAEAEILRLGGLVETVLLSTEPSVKSYERGAAALDVTGGKLTVTKYNGAASEVALTVDMASGYDLSASGEQTVTVTYLSLTAGSYKIQVNNPAEVASVVDLILQLPLVNNLVYGDKAQVDAARSAYDALPGDAYKAWVTNYQTLTAAEAKIAELGQKAVSLSWKAGSEPATQALVNSAYAASGVAVVTKADGSTEEVAAGGLTLGASDWYTYNGVVGQTAYVRLVYDGIVIQYNVTFISGYKSVVFDEMRYAFGEGFSYKNRVTVTYMDDTSEIIDFNGTNFTIQSSAYNPNVPGAYPSRFTLKSRKGVADEIHLIDLIVDYPQSVLTFNALAAALPELGQLVYADYTAVFAARAAYGAIAPDHLKWAVGLNKVAALEAQIEQLAPAAAASVEAVIAALGDAQNLTLNDADAVTAARTAYNALYSAHRSQVQNYQNLVDAENKILALTGASAAAATVTALINALPAANALVYADKPQVDAARTAYDGLTPEEKAFVANLA
ncbi:MAG: bacterial Ig-like domain-containing protein, partial [Clostridiales bacterium]|nr:bacterial Ig-like domain-containing protein [Clostridiales bacterium]